MSVGVGPPLVAPTGRGDDAVTVAAVVVTYQRPNMLGRCLQALLTQTVALAEVIVVDNGRDHATRELLSASFSTVKHLEMPDNLGPAGGYAVGMAYAHQRGHDQTWLFNDDAIPTPEALQECLEGRTHLRGRPGVVAHDAVPTTSADPSEVPVFNFNGALVDREVIDRTGYPRTDLFMCHEEHEYSERIRAAGLPIINLPTGHIAHDYAGSSRGPSPPWRGYYQTRNELLTLRDRPSLRGSVVWLKRTAKFTVGALFVGDHGLKRVGYRILGIWHGLKGVTGRTIEPNEVGGN
jgi:rhamnopyranosyl-N-acetylglucosaminyl-diphospho-decaprenol beta-1,3/1,4-galactofuranosyltransferase